MDDMISGEISATNIREGTLKATNVRESTASVKNLYESTARITNLTMIRCRWPTTFDEGINRA